MSAAPTATPKILLIEDDVELSQMLCEYLEPHGYHIELAHTGYQASRLLRTQRFDMALLDLMLPDINGLELLKRYREHSAKPVIMFTAHGSEADRIRGLECGADDYLAKPFNPVELKARINAVLRRFHAGREKAAEPALQALSMGPLSLNTALGRTTLDGQDVTLTGTEQRVLEILMRSAGDIVYRNAMCEFALGRVATPHDRSIDTHISSLRRKLAQACATSRVIIRNLRGQGYLLAIEEDAA